MRPSILFLVIATGVVSTGVSLGAGLFLYLQSAQSVKALTTEVAVSQLNNLAADIGGLFTEIVENVEGMVSLALLEPRNESFWTGPHCDMLRVDQAQKEELQTFVQRNDRGMYQMVASGRDQATGSKIILHAREIERNGTGFGQPLVRATATYVDNDGKMLGKHSEVQWKVVMAWQR